MQFPTATFALFILLALPFWHVLSGNPKAKAFFSLILSGIFLHFSSDASFWSAACYFCFTLLVSMVIQRCSKLTCAFIIALMLCPLLYFKYGAWLAEALPSILPYTWSQPTPFGLSFYTFSCLAWIISLRQLPPESPRLYSASSAFIFPVICSGPVVRPHELGNQWSAPLTEYRFDQAATPFLLGLFLKLAVASQLALVADPIFAHLDQANALTLTLAIHAYAGQLYADFAGYSLMAIGVGRALGMELPSNFNAPYASLSIGEFWRRWHQSLSAFWRDFIYIPLGGSRAGRTRELLNLTIVMLLCGLWHGAGASFLCWGALHALMLCGARVYQWSKMPRLPTWLAWVLTFELVCWAWLPFRLSQWDLFSQALDALLILPSSIPAIPLSLIAGLFAIALEHRYTPSVYTYTASLGQKFPALFVFLCIIVLCTIIELSPEGIPGFIYANF